MKLADFDYVLPAELIAQKPAEPRDSSRLMVVDRQKQTIGHDYFYNLDQYLSSNDVVVFNDTKVFPARLLGNKITGGKVEVLLLRFRVQGSRFKNGGEWEFISHPGLREGQEVIFNGAMAKVQNNRLIFNIKNTDMTEFIETNGHTPLPPYIIPGTGVSEPKIRQMYQTVYAKVTGSAAAPTAGFHFTEKLLERLRDKGIETEFVTLHVGLGTFRPVKTENIEDHEMHSEYYSIPAVTAERLMAAKRQGKRIIAVGTTTVRTLESWSNSGQTEGDTKIFIYPGYKFKFVDAMITNFHLPKSTLMMLVAAFAGREVVMRGYAEAVKEKYRFFSFGDAMLIY